MNKRVVFIIVGIAIIVLISLTIGKNNSSRFVESPKIDTIYLEASKRDSIKIIIDSTLFILNNNDRYEKEFNEVVSDTDSISIVRKFIKLCTE